MPIYLAPYVGTGKPRSDSFRPYGYDQPYWSTFDLRRDCTKTGKCLVSYPFVDNHRKLKKIAEHGSELEPWVKTLGFDEFHLGNWSWYKDQFRDEVVYERIARDFVMSKWKRPSLIAACGIAAISTAILSFGLLTWQEVGLLLPPVMALPATDDFAGSGALSANWTPMNIGNTGFANVRVSGQAAGNNTSKDIYSFWNADSFNNNQYSQIVFATMNSVTSNWCQITVRASGANTTANLYNYASNSASTEIAKWINGSQTSLQTIVADPSNGDTIKFVANGTTITAFINGSQTGSPQSDASIASGAAGFGTYDQASNLARLDNWEGGNFSSSTGLLNANKLALLGVGL